MSNFFTTSLFHIGSISVTPAVFILRFILPLCIFFVIIMTIQRLLRKLINNLHKNDLQIDFHAIQKKTPEIREQQEKQELQQKKKRIQKRFLRRGTFFVSVIGYFIIIMYFIEYITPFEIIDVFRVLNKPFYSSSTTNISIITVLGIILLAYISYVISVFVRRSFKKMLSTLPSDTSKRFRPLTQVVSYCALILSFMLGLSMIGIDISSMTVILGVVGVGVGFGLQDIVANFFSGLVIGFTRIVAEGDRVFIQGVEGDVQRINLINTTLRLLTYEELIIPNKFIINEAIQNYSHSDSMVVIRADIQVDYNSDMHQVKKVLLQVGNNSSWKIPDKEVIFRLPSFDDSGISVSVFVWIDDVRDRYAAHTDLNMAIWEAFKQEGISIPFPQMDLHVREVPSHIHENSGGKNSSVRNVLASNTIENIVENPISNKPK